MTDETTTVGEELDQIHRNAEMALEVLESKHPNAPAVNAVEDIIVRTERILDGGGEDDTNE